MAQKKRNNPSKLNELSHIFRNFVFKLRKRYLRHIGSIALQSPPQVKEQSSILELYPYRLKHPIFDDGL